MKTLFLSIAASGLLALNLFSQKAGVKPTTIPDSYYQLDSVGTPGKIQHFAFDSSPNFLLFSQGEATLSGRYRGLAFFFQGPVKKAEIRKEKTGEEYTYCYLLLNPSSGTTGTLSLELKTLPDGKISVHAYMPLGDYDRMFIAHTAKVADLEDDVK